MCSYQSVFISSRAEIKAALHIPETICPAGARTLITLLLCARLVHVRARRALSAHANRPHKVQMSLHVGVTSRT